MEDQLHKFIRAEIEQEQKFQKIMSQYKWINRSIWLGTAIIIVTIWVCSWIVKTRVLP